MSDDDDDRNDKPDFSSLLGPEPEWLTCSCGVQSARVPCWDCSRSAESRTRETEQRTLAVSTIPARFAWARLGAPELRDRVKAPSDLKALSERILASANVVFAGPSGSGKTSLAVACLRERIPHGIFVSSMRLSTARIQNRAGEGEASLVERAMTAPLVLLDEVGGEAKTSTNAVKDVIFARADADLPTWITTGFNHTQLVDMYGDGALRRMTENAMIVRFGKAA